MRKGSKRWRKYQLFRRRKLRRIDLAWATRWPQQIADHPEKFTEKRMKRYNRAIARLNMNLRKIGDGGPQCDGSVECPVCHREVPTFGDPDEWTRNSNPARLKKSWDVSGYWPGIAEHCGLLLAPDFEQRAIVIDEEEYKRAKARIQEEVKIQTEKWRNQTFEPVTA